MSVHRTTHSAVLVATPSYGFAVAPAAMPSLQLQDQQDDQANIDGSRRRKSSEDGKAVVEKSEGNGNTAANTQVQHAQKLDGKEQNDANHAKSATEDILDPTAVPSDCPLPLELYKILYEVAKTGKCSNLPWLQAQKQQPQQPDTAPQSRSNSAASSPASTSRNTSSMKGSGSFSQMQNSSSSNIHRRPVPPYATAQPPRKKLRNGIHTTSTGGNSGGGGTNNNNNNNTRGSSTSLTATKQASGRKRPLFLIRTGMNNSMMSPAGNKTSGSEMEDTTSHYECDSEGTSASELSHEPWRRNRAVAKKANRKNAARDEVGVATASTIGSGTFHSLHNAIKISVETILDDYFNNGGGYKPSRLELKLKDNKNTNTAASKSTKSPNLKKGDEDAAPEAASESKKQQQQQLEKDLFVERKSRIIAMLGDEQIRTNADLVVLTAPFTIQRVAEVLLDPKRYYTQTQKLCNCLEKLLMVSSSVDSFGGSKGGDTTQNRREEREMAALAYEKERLHTELRRKFQARRESMKSSIAESDGVERSASPLSEDGKQSPQYTSEAGGSGTLDDEQHDKHSYHHDGVTQDEIEAAARKQLRSKFDHSGIEHNHPTSSDQDALAEGRGLTGSPPLLASNISIPGHGVRHGDHGHLSPRARPSSPIVYSPGKEPASPPSGPYNASNPHVHLLQLHNAAIAAGLSPMDMVNNQKNNNSNSQSPTLSGVKETEVDGRSSASSDLGSESDDSMSDRSDGSDAGNHESSTTKMKSRSAHHRRMRESLNMLNSRNNHNGSSNSDVVGSVFKAEDSGESDSSDITE